MSAHYNLPATLVTPKGVTLAHHWAYLPGIAPSWEIQKARARQLKGSIRKVSVLPRNLRGKRDLHGKLYAPGEWIFCSLPYRVLLPKQYESNPPHLPQ